MLLKFNTNTIYHILLGYLFQVKIWFLEAPAPSEFSCLCLIAHLTEASCIVEKEQETVKQTNIGLVPIM